MHSYAVSDKYQIRFHMYYVSETGRVSSSADSYGSTGGQNMKPGDSTAINGPRHQDVEGMFALKNLSGKQIYHIC